MWIERSYAKRNSNFWLPGVLISFFLLAATPLWMGPGLNDPQPVEPYLNNVFPTTSSGGGSTSIGIVPYKESIQFNSILGMAQAPRSDIFYVIERSGFIYSFDKTATTPTKLLFRNMSNQIWDGQDSGLLGFAFHPDFNKAGSPNRNYIYIFYVTTLSNGRHFRVARITRSSTGEVYEDNSEEVLIEQIVTTNLHRGGALVFGDDGFLYISIGDLGLKPQSQNITDKLCGGVLRIDVDQQGGNISHPIRRTLQQLNQGNTGNYFIPNDNPWQDPNGGLMEEYYAIGCRSPHKMSKDIATGTIYIGNVGSNSGIKKEEINVLSKGANFGWPFREGEADRPDLMARPLTILGSLQDPLHYYEHLSGNRSINGGFVYRGTRIPELQGKYIFGDYGSSNIWSMNSDGTEKTLIGKTPARFATFGQDADGEVYIGLLANNRAIYTLDAVSQVDIPDGWYYLRARHSRKVLDVSTGSTANGANVHQWTKNNTANQQWFIKKLADGAYSLEANHSNKFLEAAGNGTTRGTNIQQWAWTGTNSQRWAFELVDDGYFLLRNIHNNLYTDVSGASTDNQANIHLWTKHGRNNQQWEIIPVDGPAVTAPKFLSETQAFSDLGNMTPAQGIIPYTVNTSLWSDGSEKMRWISLPNDGTHDTAGEQVKMDHLGQWRFEEARGEWAFPPGTIFIKHFELALNENTPSLRKKLETRFVVLLENNQFYGLTYKWNEAGTDAELLYEGLSENFTIQQADGASRIQSWTYPSRSECLNCHTQASGGVLGPQTSQLTGDLLYPSTGITANQLETWDHLNMLDRDLNVVQIQKFISSRSIDDETASLEQRVRSYLDANCSSCHRPNGGPRSEFDLRIETNLDGQQLINGPIIEDLGIPDAKLIVPGSPEKSILYQRIKQVNTPDAMPPLAKNRLHQEGVDLIEAWINSLPGNGGGLKATYFADVTLSTPAINRIDRAVDFNWDVATPEPGFQRTNFSVRWEGYVEARFDELYTFSIIADDGFRMWVDGQQIIDDWRTRAPREGSGQIQLTKGFHEVKIEYFQGGGHARVHLFWESPSQSRELIPAMHMVPELNLTFSLKCFLEGPYDTNANLMKDELREKGLITTTDPYGLGETLSPGLLNIPGVHAIVDWIKVEVREKDAPWVILAEKACLLRRDGTVIEANGRNSLIFKDLAKGEYYISIRHYNHLSLASQSYIDLSNPALIDFSDLGTNVWGGENAGLNQNGLRMLVGGDANGDGTINATDKNGFWRIENGNPFQYGSSKADFNLDGVINAVDKNVYWRGNNSRVALLPE